MYFSSFLSSTVVPLIDCQFQCKCSVLVMTESIINSLCNIPDFRALYIDDFIALFQHLDFLTMDINRAEMKFKQRVFHVTLTKEHTNFYMLVT